MTAGLSAATDQALETRERLLKEAESNVAIRVTDTPGGEAFEVAGRGELQMGVLIENMRPPVKDRLGFDFGTVHARNPPFLAPRRQRGRGKPPECDRRPHRARGRPAPGASRV